MGLYLPTAGELLIDGRNVRETAPKSLYRGTSADKTAFIVTHRLGSARIADRIIVMDAGHIVDMGTHEELMQREGKYRQMYHAQAKWYVQRGQQEKA